MCAPKPLYANICQLSDWKNENWSLDVLVLLYLGKAPMFSPVSEAYRPGLSPPFLSFHKLLKVYIYEMQFWSFVLNFENVSQKCNEFLPPQNCFFPWEMSNRLGTSERDQWKKGRAVMWRQLICSAYDFNSGYCFVFCGVQWCYLTVRSKWRFWRWFESCRQQQPFLFSLFAAILLNILPSSRDRPDKEDVFGWKFACFEGEKINFGRFFYEFRLRIHILHTIKNDHKIVSCTLKN